MPIQIEKIPAYIGHFVFVDNSNLFSIFCQIDIDGIWYLISSMLTKGHCSGKTAVKPISHTILLKNMSM